MPMPITHIYFDWSGTLAKSGSKYTFIYGKTRAEKCGTLVPGIKEFLAKLAKMGYILGIISNSSKPRDLFLRSLEECGLRKFFKGAIVFSDQRGLCKKPCADIFQYALKIDKIGPENAMMVGDKLSTDILGARSARFAETLQV